MEAIYLLRRVMEQQDLYLIFIDLDKEYDIVPKEVLWKSLENKGLGLHIFYLSKICMKGYLLVCRHGVEKWRISPLQ